jgi:hypothetical protein
VVELFEARKPKDPAVISEIDGVVKDGGVVKGQRKMIIVPDDATEPREYALPRGVHVNVHEGERVRAGEQLMDGPSNPHDILRVLGEKELQKYLVNEIQEVYRLQGVNINDKHIEVISRQMMRWVKIEDVGDTEFLIDEQVDKFRFLEENERVRAGEQLMDGPSNPHDILRVLGEKELQKYLVNEIQEVYRLQGVNINDKHIEVITRQMMRWVRVEDVGDTEFLVDEQVDKFRFMEENERVIGNGGRPATAQPLLLGIT